MAPGYEVISFYMARQFQRLMSGRSILAIWGKGWGFPGIRLLPTFGHFWSALVDVLAQKGREELLHVQGQEGQLVQVKGQRLHFAGAAVKRYPKSKVTETQVRR